MYQPNFLSAYMALVSALCLMAAGAHAHPFHTSNAEMEFNPKTGRFEVSLRVLASDLDEALRRQKLTNLGLPTDVDSQIVAYLESRVFFSAHNPAVPQDQAYAQAEKPRSTVRAKEDSTAIKPVPGGDKQPRQGLYWAGKELDKSWIWLYFELDIPRGADAVALTNTVFLELNTGQINVCTLRMGTTKKSLRTDEKRPFVALPPDMRTH